MSIWAGASSLPVVYLSPSKQRCRKNFKVNEKKHSRLLLTSESDGTRQNTVDCWSITTISMVKDKLIFEPPYGTELQTGSIDQTLLHGRVCTLIARGKIQDLASTNTV